MKKLLALLCLLPSLGWCDSKISAFPSTTTLNAGDIIPVVTNPTTSPANKVITFQNLQTQLGTGGGGVVPIVNTGSLYQTPYVSVASSNTLSMSSDLMQYPSSAAVTVPLYVSTVTAVSSMTVQNITINGTCTGAGCGGGSVVLTSSGIAFGSPTNTVASDTNTLRWDNTAKTVTIISSSPLKMSDTTDTQKLNIYHTTLPINAGFGPQIIDSWIWGQTADAGGPDGGLRIAISTSPFLFTPTSDSVPANRTSLELLPPDGVGDESMKVILGSKQWLFGFGNLTFPDSSVQSTAFSGYNSTQTWTATQAWSNAQPSTFTALDVSGNLQRGNYVFTTPSTPACIINGTLTAGCNQSGVMMAISSVTAPSNPYYMDSVGKLSLGQAGPNELNVLGGVEISTANNKHLVNSGNLQLTYGVQASTYVSTAMSGSGTQCVQVDNTGLFSGTGLACGSGAGGSGIVSPGTFTWTNSQGIILSTETVDQITFSGNNTTLMSLPSYWSFAYSPSFGGSVTETFSKPTNLAFGGNSLNVTAGAFAMNGPFGINGKTVLYNGSTGNATNKLDIVGGMSVGYADGSYPNAGNSIYSAFGVNAATGVFSTSLTVSGQNVCQANGTNCLASSGGSSSLAVTTGSAAGFSSIASSPTAVINLDANFFSATLQGTATGYVTIISTGAAGTVLTSNGAGLGAGWKASSGGSGTKPPLTFTWDGGGVVIATAGVSLARFTELPYAVTITSSVLSCTVATGYTAATSTFSVTVSTQSAATFNGATGYGSICASDCPSLASQAREGDGTLTGWVTSLNAGEYVWVDLNAPPQAATYCQLQIWVN